MTEIESPTEKLCFDIKMNVTKSHVANICFGLMQPCRFNPLNAKLNPICHLLGLLGAYHILHISRIKVKHMGLTFY